MSTEPPKYYQTAGHNIAAGVALSVLAILAVGARFWTRLSHRQGLKADDWLIVPPAILTVATGITIIYGVAKKALGHHLILDGVAAHAASTPQTELAGKIQWALDVIFPVAVGFLKLSFLTFYTRIFVIGKKGGVFWLLTGTMIFVVLWTVAFLFTSLFWCGTQFSALWGSTEDLIEDCVDTEKILEILTITDFIFDVWIILLPIPLIYTLQLSAGRKIGTCLVFLLGAIVIAASLTRMVIVIKIVRDGFDPKVDGIYAVTAGLYWQMVECGVAILAACMPTFSIFAKSITIINLWNSITSLGRDSRGSGSRGRRHTTSGSGSQSEGSPSGPYTRSPSEPGHGSVSRFHTKTHTAHVKSVDVESTELETLPKVPKVPEDVSPA